MNIKATLIIGTYDSRCANCNEGAFWDDSSHDRLSGYGKAGEPGCGIKWENVTSEYFGLDEYLCSMRPDLNPIPAKEFSDAKYD